MWSGQQQIATYPIYIFHNHLVCLCYLCQRINTCIVGIQLHFCKMTLQIRRPEKKITSNLTHKLCLISSCQGLRVVALIQLLLTQQTEGNFLQPAVLRGTWFIYIKLKLADDDGDDGGGTVLCSFGDTEGGFIAEIRGQCVVLLPEAIMKEPKQSNKYNTFNTYNHIS